MKTCSWPPGSGHPHRDAVLDGFGASCVCSSCEGGGMHLEVNQDAGYSVTDIGRCLEF